MEKSAITGKRQFCNRLLIIFLGLLCLPAFSETLSTRQLRELKVTPQSETFFSQQDCNFTLVVPGIRPENIRTTLPKLPVGVQFRSSRRSDFIDSDRDVGTQIDFWFSFSVSGTYTIPPLDVVINNRNYKISFLPVSIYENPATISPKLIIRFTEGILGQEKDNDSVFNANSLDSKDGFNCAVGTKIYLTVYLKYAVQVLKFDWQLQKDALFKELERFEITKGITRGTEFSTEEFPVAKFEWIPLIAGDWNLPEIKITATAYNGSRVDIATPSCSIKVLPNSKKSENHIEKDNNNIFAYAFTEVASSSETQKVITLEKAECQKLAELRSLERHSFPFGKNLKIRKEYENQHGINSSANEPNVSLLYFYIACSLILTFFAVFFAIKRKKISILFFVLASGALTMMILQCIKLSTDYAVFGGGIISPIPENISAATQNEPGGNRVKIIEKTGNWRYISFNGSGGWVSKDAVFEIK